jgi:hypothetical protein
VTTKKPAKSKAVPGTRQIKNVPQTLGRKQLNLPKTTRFRPGMLLPANMARTRSMARREAELLNESPMHSSSDDEDTENSDSEEEEMPPLESDGEHGEHAHHGINEDTESETDTDPETDSEDNNDTPDQEDIVIHDRDPENTVLYTEVGNVTNMVSDGMITVTQFRDAQRTDDFCLSIILGNADKRYEISNDILCRTDRNKQRPVMPRCLYDTIIQTKHFTAFGAHMSATRILRDIKNSYFLPGKEFEKRLRKVTSECYLCQMFNTNVVAHEVQQLPQVTAPRVSWSIDMITDPPITKTGNKQILLCVDDFSSYVVCIPVQNATAENVLKGLKDMLFNQFGIPKILRSDQQASFYPNEPIRCKPNHNCGCKSIL